MDPEDETGSTVRCQKLHDLHNYLSTFNKEIESGDDVLSNMDVDSGVGDVSDLYSSNPDNPLQDSGDGPVTSQFSSGFYSEQGILDTSLSDESAHQMQNMVAGVDRDADMTTSIKQEVAALDLDNVQAQLAHLSHGMDDIHASSIPQGLIMTSMGDNLDPSAGKVIRIVSLDGDSQYLSIADSSQMQILSQDLGISTEALHLSDSHLRAESSTAIASSSTSSSILGSIGGAAMVVAGRNNLMTVTADSATGAITGDTQLVALQSTSDDSTQPQLVTLPQRTVLTAETLQNMSGLLTADRTDIGYQTITILPSELSQNGDMNYFLIMTPQEAQKDDSQPLAQVVESLKQETQDLSEELVEINGEMKRVLRVIPKKFIAANFGTQLMCDYCDYTSPKRYLLTRHMKSHSDERPHKCRECDRGFKTPASLLNHSNTHTGTRPHKCKTCDAAFTTSGELVRHIRYRHTFEKPHRCPDCDYASVELSKLKRHMRSHTGERPYKCPHCTYASPDTYKLKRHLRIHTGEKPYECDICHARFTQSNSLKAHKLIHSGNKPVFQCDLCPTTCGRKTDLKIHFNKLHSMGSPLECKKCSQTFSDRYSYKQHVRGHDVDKCFKCDMCEFVASTERAFDLHAAVHSDGHKFECDVCSMSFKLQQTLEKHKRSCQPETESRVESRSSPSSQDKKLGKEEAVFSLGNCISTPVTSGQLVSGPLASDTLHRNLLQDIKAGKLGDVPQVVIVHPDGSLEEISSKADRLNLEEIFSALSSSTKAESTHKPAERNQTKESSDRADNTAVHSKMRNPHGKQGLSDEEVDSDEEDEEDEEEQETGEASQCEASTQAELESDTDSVGDDDDDDSCSNDSPSQFPQAQKENQQAASSMKFESTVDNSASSDIETSSLHHVDTPSDTLGSLLHNVTSSPSLLSSAVPTVLPLSGEQSVTGNQQFVVVKGYTCLSSDGAQPTLVNVAVDKDSLMKMLASLATSNDTGMHLLTGDLESSVALSVDSSQTAVVPLAQLQLNNFDSGLSSSLILGANFENDELNTPQDLVDTSSKACTSLLDSCTKASTSMLDSCTNVSSPSLVSSCEASTPLLDSISKTHTGFLDSGSKNNTNMMDSNSKAGMHLLDASSRLSKSLLESSSKLGASLPESVSTLAVSLSDPGSTLGVGLITYGSPHTNNRHKLASCHESVNSKTSPIADGLESKHTLTGSTIPSSVTSSSLPLLKGRTVHEKLSCNSETSMNNDKAVKNSFSEEQIVSDNQEQSSTLSETSVSRESVAFEAFQGLSGILGSLTVDGQVLEMAGVTQGRLQLSRTVSIDGWDALDAGSAASQGSLAASLTAVFENALIVEESSSSHCSPDAQVKQIPPQEKQKGSNRKRTATTDVDQSLVMTGKRVRKSLVKVSM